MQKPLFVCPFPFRSVPRTQKKKAGQGNPAKCRVLFHEVETFFSGLEKASLITYMLCVPPPLFSPHWGGGNERYRREEQKVKMIQGVLGLDYLWGYAKNQVFEN